MSEKNIIDFKVGDEIQGFFIIKSMNIKTSSNNKMYLDLTITDKTGEINSKIWDVNDQMPDLYKAGQTIKIKGNVTSWQNNLQLKITRIRPIVEEDDVDVENLVSSAPLKASDMYSEMLAYVEKIENEDIRKLVNYFIALYEKELMVYPAAKSNHHAIRSGLLYHIVRMLRTGERLAEVYENINRDLLIAGIILHDIEKINEMNSDNLGIVSDYTVEGSLLGHIIMGIKKIDEVARTLDVDDEISKLLQHMVLSHHYHPEFGSPKKPMIPEAELLHYIDMIDARMYDMEKVYRNMENGELSDSIFTLDRRRLYKPTFHE